MTDIMRPVSFGELVNRTFSEIAKEGTVFSFNKELNGSDGTGHTPLELFGETAATPVGPAAGPHTQLAQNIVTSWAAGARFFELKTVQIMDTLEIEKPCIDAEDEGFNTEWSTEYTLDKAYDEYLKAWFLLHMMEALYENHPERQFIFNMSVGYDLKGIQNPRMDQFINRLMDSGAEEKFRQYKQELDALASDPSFLKGTGLEEKADRLKGLADRISPRLCRSMTLSTMHGCPPEEIEKIAVYLLTEKKIHTFVKLNPTLLGFDTVRSILDELGFDYVGLKPESFDHDLQYPDAVAMLTRLIALAEKQGLSFGVKLTNTLGSVNNKGALPGEEMYMSGRALFPISIQVALKLSREFDGSLPISFSGGASVLNMKELIETGIRPVTMATEMLKPGGYGRMAQAVEKAKEAADWNRTSIDLQALEALAAKAMKAPEYKKDWRGTDAISTEEELPLYDCAVAPCKTACAIHQDVPEYLRLVGMGRYADALEVIYNKNPLPFITGWICDHKCHYNCTRLDYDGTVKIREMKKIAAQQGFDEYLKRFNEPGTGVKKKAAIIGAGPAGLAAAYFLRKGGMEVSVFEREDGPGGVIRNVLPSFRMPPDQIEKDMDFIKMHGVDFHFGVKDISVPDLKAKGYDSVLIAIGAEKDRDIGLSGGRVMTSLEFLEKFRHDPEGCNLGENVAIVGGGNTAMDSARSAVRAPGVKKVRVIYRRTLKEMPADREEYYDASDEGISFHFLRNPAAFTGDGQLSCSVMELGEPDESGRRRPVQTDKTESFPVDTLITAIGETVDNDMLRTMGLPLEGQWAKLDEKTHETELPGVYLVGDAQSGPDSIVGAMGSARKSVNAILASEAVELPALEAEKLDGQERKDLLSRKSRMISTAENPDEFAAWAANEASRCLQCDVVCNKCVDVCPNRANVVIKSETGFGQETQILHVDAYCNECGNCAQFCPWEGRPYKDKITVFSTMEDFESSDNNGFILSGSGITLRQSGSTFKLNWDGKELSGAIPGGDDGKRTAVLLKTILKDYSWYQGAVED
ncbi:MAG: putative selenate reductase subunit YgfK [Spirochaetales bacterium]|nr:putative selenate reductase subunit YgfK [Spirochaetales bacterium]